MILNASLPLDARAFPNGALINHSKPREWEG
jgi:hypothetical protein